MRVLGNIDKGGESIQWGIPKYGLLDQAFSRKLQLVQTGFHTLFCHVSLHHITWLF